ncbi:MAG: alkylhydroperoxidase, partial [Planctomycetes bacterium GWF2_39_10]
VEELGKVVKQEGPLDERTAHLIQLAAAATVHSEGAVHSHVRRAMDAGVTADEIYHAIILLTSTIGFPSVVAALSWADDVIKARRKK